MEALRIAVCEDSAIEQKRLIFLINGCGIPAVVSAFDSGEALLADFGRGKYDLIFMDIYMEGMTGIDAVTAIRKIDSHVPVAFATTSTEFALESSVKRILEPQEPVFKCGESGILTFTTWGYADRVEVIFPECMTALDPTLNKVYDYTESQGYRKTEELEFMVPLYTPENQTQEITVRAYKGDKRLEDHPTISVIGVSGNVLDELRTRLR